MREDLTFIAVVLDRSGSMASVAEDTIGGINAFIEDQKKQPGAALFTLALFDDQYETPYRATPLECVQPLTHETYQPRGSTALRDAVGRTIDELGSCLAAMPEAERPAKVVVLVQTDGFENASRWYSRACLQEMIARQRDVYKWTFTFVGATEESLQGAADLGFMPGKMRAYAATPAGTANVLRGMSVGTASYRNMSTKDAEVFAASEAAFFEPNDKQ